MVKSHVFAAVAVLIGTIVGAGFLGIPYVVSQSGFLIGAIHIIFLGLIIMAVNLCMGEVVLRTKGEHQMTGYAEKYLGGKGKSIMFFMLVFGIFSALVAYLVGISESISYLIRGDASLSLFTALAIWVFLSLITFFGMKTFKQGEVIGLILVTLFFFGIFFYLFPKVSIENLSHFIPSNFFAPFGTVLFALLAFSAIPELGRILEKEKKKMKRVIFLGSFIPIIGYLIFTLIVVGVKGAAVPEISTIGLGAVFVYLGIITMTTSYFALATVLKSMLHFDYNFKKSTAWALISGFSLLLYIITIKMHFGFSNILNASGIISGSITGILIMLMLRKAKREGDKKPEYSFPLNAILIVIITLVFVLGGILGLAEMH